ncbi:hypothetical protein CFK40_12155 [Virgibacillus necropolis]|uniref:histidine kinase n=1 Tax=Virgibacillus necropolis TaxID=163877 RepID=A0A221MDD7_9BACI|nr:hypothetical protein CFK40_12155 [Virgibacillus necropolis]
MDTAHYLDVFLDESNEHLESLYKQLIALEKNPTEKSTIDDIFRSAHTLKGMSAAMGFDDLANLTHQLENIFDGIRYDKIIITTETMDVLFESVDHLNAMVESITGGGNGKRDMEQIIDSLKKIENGDCVVSTPKTIASGEKMTDVLGVKKKSSSSKTIRVNIERLDSLINLFDELVIDRGRLEQISSELNHNDLQATVERMSRVSSDLQRMILTMRMVPVEQVFSRFPQMIRRLARDLGKNVEIEIVGAETELDRTVIDKIGDPFVHLIRNAMDHGIEAPNVRKVNGKPKHGTIKLHAYYSGNHVFIEISDDGAGINKDKVLNKALSDGVITENQAGTLADQQVYELIMASGFSTAETITDISGRGVGLDVVKSTIESLGGTITIDTKLGKGSTFSIQLPLTLASTRSSWNC